MSRERFGGREADPAQMLAGRLGELREAETEVGELIAREDYHGAATAARTARAKAEEVLDFALEIAKRQPAGPVKEFPVDVIRQAEVRLGVAEGTFSWFFDPNPATPRRPGNSPVRTIEGIRDEIRAQAIADEIHEVPAWLPKLVTIASAVVVGTFIGAPLAALAVNESVLIEVAKAGIVLTVGAVGAVLTEKIVESKLEPRPPDEVAAPPPTGPAPALDVSKMIDELSALDDPDNSEILDALRELDEPEIAEILDELGSSADVPSDAVAKDTDELPMKPDDELELDEDLELDEPDFDW